MKDKILKMRNAGFSYREIANSLGCSKSVINYHCANGAKEKVKERRKKNRDSKKEWRVRRVLYLRRLVWRYKKRVGCIDCREKDPRVLDLDHNDRSLKTMHLSKMIDRAASISTVKSEIRKCSVRCANCHRIKTWDEFNYCTF